MKLMLILVPVVVAALLTGAKRPDNPFFLDWNTPFGVPPFDQIKIEHYLPAFARFIQQHDRQIDKIVAQAAAPTFENTIAALDRSGGRLDRVDHVFSAMHSAMTNPELERIAEKVAPMLSKHQDAILLNERLFARVKKVHDTRDSLDLDPEQHKLVEEIYKRFVRGGALLPPEQKKHLQELNARLAELTLQFGQNVLKENNRFELVIDRREDLAGLPANVIAAAAEAGTERGHDGKWVFTLHKPSLIPFLQYSERRALREKIYRAYFERGNHNDKLDNKKILAEIVALRTERAQLLGFATHADYVLDDCMAKRPENVYKLLEQVWTPALAKARQEVVEMQKIIDGEGGDFKLQSWDWWYYAEKVKKSKYDLDEEMLRPYFELDNVRKGAFAVASRLYGLQFIPRDDLPIYHKDVSAFQVQDATGKHVGILYVDYFPRASKRGGAWMSEFRMQWKQDGKNIRPVIYNVGNFSKPTADKPSLLSFEEVRTLFHEFGHALHGLSSDCEYKTLACTNVARDFVELPSQIMENWASEPEVLKMYARHYKTGAPMLDELIAKIQKARFFNQGFATTEYLAASFLDMDWHTRTKTDPAIDVLAFENRSMQRIGLIPEIIPRYRSPYFQHIFAGDYSAGYYSYVWAEVLDADAFAAFKETGNIFDPKTAKAFHDNILTRGGTDDPMKLYKQFRGSAPSIQPLLERRGLAGS